MRSATQHFTRVLNAGFYFTALYIVKGFPDPAWNEIDIGSAHTPVCRSRASVAASALHAPC
jgi:hypothetical protein